MGIAFLIIGALIFAASIGFLSYFLYKFCKSLTLGGVAPKVEGDNRLIFISLVLSGGIGFLVLSLGMVLFNSWAFDVGNYLTNIFGAFFFGTAINLFISSFTLYFSRKDLDPKQRKVAQIAMISAIPLFIAGLWMWTDSFALFIKYPLPNSISFSKGLGYPDYGDYGFTLAFYGIIIVSGALISYFICDHYVYAKFGKHGLLDTLFLVAFPLGLVGARLWWCIVLEPAYIFHDDFGSSFMRIVDVRNGGLAIQGGALLGMISGILFAVKFRKYINIRWLVDVCIPTILIAQAVGRWGNFFNQEVYGATASVDAWWFLPKMIRENMVIAGSFRIPLFFIESLINICGYFIIRYPVGKCLKKYLKQGDQAFMYVLWYGLVRVGLEPLREGFTLNLGSSAAFGYLQSWITAFVMVGVGMLGMVGLRVFEYIRRKQGKEVKEYEAI